MRAFADSRFILILLAALAAITAAVGPTVERERVTYELMLVVDITRSMNARDYLHDGEPESRLAMLHRVLPAMIARLPCGSKVGLSIFTERRSFTLFTPTEVCTAYQVISESIAGLNWRMAWEGDSRITSGLYSALDNAVASGGAAGSYDVVFITDGQEAPPLPWTGGPRFDGDVGAVGGLIVGVGGTRPVPIPKFDDRGREIGLYTMADVPQESRRGAPPPNAETRPGFHPRNNPFGDMPAGIEHLTAVRESHLMKLAAALRLGYVGLGNEYSDELGDAVRRFAHPHPVITSVDLSPVFGGLAIAVFLLSLLVAVFRRRPHHLPSSVSIFLKRNPMFKKLCLCAYLALALAAPTPSHAHGPTPQKVSEKVDIAAPCELVWSKLRDFGSIGAWHPGISKVEASGASERGAIRTLTLPNGETVEERLDEVDGNLQSIAYRLSKENLKALPVSFYTARMVVTRPDPGPTCHVEWEGRFYRGDTTNEPPEELSDAAAVTAMTAFFKQGLAGLKAAME